MCSVLMVLVVWLCVVGRVALVALVVWVALVGMDGVAVLVCCVLC